MYSFKKCIALAAAFNKCCAINHISQRHIKRYVAPTLMELTRRKKKFTEQVDNPRSSYLEWNRNAELFAFNARLTEKFNNDLLQQAFTFRSYVRSEEDKQKEVGIKEPIVDIADNWELINEGQQIVPLVIENYLSKALPRAPLECIQALKNYLLSTEVLAKTSSLIGTKDLILSTEYPITEETLVATFYALIAALNRSVDLEHTSIFIRDILIALLIEKELAEIWTPENPVAVLNDILLRSGKELAEPRIIGETGVTTLLPVYRVAVYSDKEFLGSGVGETSEEAEEIAAITALLKMFGLLDSSKPMRCDLKIDDADPTNLPLSEWMMDS